MARIYPAEFRRDAVALVRSSDKTVTQVAKELGFNRETLRQWVKQDRIDQGELEGLTSSGRLRRPAGPCRAAGDRRHRVVGPAPDPRPGGRTQVGNR